MEQEISLLDLLAAAVRKGKQIIIFAVIVGLLFMGYSYLGSKAPKNGRQLDRIARRLHDEKESCKRY